MKIAKTKAQFHNLNNSLSYKSDLRTTRTKTCGPFDPVPTFFLLNFSA